VRLWNPRRFAAGNPAGRKGATIKPTVLLKKMRAALADRKAEDMLAFDVRRVSDITDYVLLASAGSTPHLRALTEEMERVLEEQGVRQYRISGEPSTGWVVVDCLDVVAHLMLEDKRKYYALEELWERAPRVR